MPEDFVSIVSELVLQSENILRSIQEIRKADNRLKELESELIEATMNQKDESKALHETELIEKVIKDLKNDIRGRVLKLSEGMNNLKNAYNERFKGSIGEFKDIKQVEKNV